jgi:hypothetical protein
MFCGSPYPHVVIQLSYLLNHRFVPLNLTSACISGCKAHCAIAYCSNKSLLDWTWMLANSIPLSISSSPAGLGLRIRMKRISAETGCRITRDFEMEMSMSPATLPSTARTSSRCNWGQRPRSSSDRRTTLQPSLLQDAFKSVEMLFRMSNRALASFDQTSDLR